VGGEKIKRAGRRKRRDLRLAKSRSFELETRRSAASSSSGAESLQGAQKGKVVEEEKKGGVGSREESRAAAR